MLPPCEYLIVVYQEIIRLIVVVVTLDMWVELPAVTTSSQLFYFLHIGDFEVSFSQILNGWHVL